MMGLVGSFSAFLWGFLCGIAVVVGGGTWVYLKVVVKLDQAEREATSQEVSRSRPSPQLTEPQGWQVSTTR
jgi:hypothetical protein